MSDLEHRTPVIIPAYAAEKHIGKTLDSLPASLTDPIVAINGEPDGTADIAEQFGVKTFTIPEQGKMPAIQEALKALGERALQPTLILDADTYPVFPSGWVHSMVGRMTMPVEAPQGVSGHVRYTGDNPVYSLIHSFRRARFAYRSQRNPDMDPPTGPNMGIHIHNEETLNSILALPNLWPGEDLAMADKIKEHGGEFHPYLSPRATVASPMSESFPGFLESLRMGKDASKAATQQAYADRGPAGSIPYRVWREQSQPQTVAA